MARRPGAAASYKRAQRKLIYARVSAFGSNGPHGHPPWRGPDGGENLCRTINRLDLLDDERFADQGSRAIDYAVLTEELKSTLVTKPTADWAKLLQGNGIMACSPYTWKQVVENPLIAKTTLHLRSAASTTLSRWFVPRPGTSP